MNQSYLTEEFYQKIGSTWIIDSINLYLVSPTGFAGFLLNLASFGIMLKINQSTTKLYIYLRYYSLNSALMCLIGAFTFVSSSPRYFPYFTNYYAMFYKCRIFNFVGASFYFFGNLLDILIALERLCIFLPFFKAISWRFSSLKFICPLLFFCFFVNLNSFFSIYVQTESEFIQEAQTNLNSLSYCGYTEYAYSFPRKILVVIIVVVRDVLTIVLEIVLSFLAIYYCVNYSRRSTSNNVNRSRVIIGKRLLKMILAILFMSNLSHFVVASTYLTGFNTDFNRPPGYFYLLFLSNLSICFKHFSNIFLFFVFDANFRNVVFCVRNQN
jgi:hypothetical protein